MNKRVAVIIPTLNEEATIGSLIKSIADNDYKNKEIIVVDGGSSDNTIKIAEQLGATVLKETGEKKDLCPANARNQGAMHSRADIISFLDADCTGVNEQFISNAVAKLKENVAAAYAGYRSSQRNCIEKALGKKNGISMHPTFVRRDAFLATGGYPLIGYGEDAIFNGKVADYAEKHGLKTIELPGSYWTGHPASSLRELYVQNRWYGRTLPIYNKHAGKKGLGSIRTYFKPIYFLSFLFMLLAVLNPFFIIAAIPFLLIFFIMLAKNRGWQRVKVFLNLVSGLAMLHGLLSYTFSSNVRKGR